MLSLDFNNEVVKAAPIVGTGVADGAARLFFGLSLNEWFYVAAIAYTVAQIGTRTWWVLMVSLKTRSTR